jgi:hypothetical protein
MTAEKLFEDHIFKEFVSTAMGSGWHLKLYNPIHKTYVEKTRFLDLFEGEDHEYGEWKQNMLEWALYRFKEEYMNKWIHDFEEFLQIDKD